MTSGFGELTRQAQALVAAGDLAGARTLLTASLDGVDPDPETASAELTEAAGLLARVLVAGNDAPAAQHWAAFAHAAATRQYGPTDQRTVATGATLAAVLHRIGDHDQAARLYRYVIIELTATDGPESLRVLAAHADLATVEYALGECDVARSRLTEAWELHREIYGDGHPSGIRMLARLGVMHRDCGLLGTAHEQLALAGELCRQHLPADHPLAAQIAALADTPAAPRHRCPPSRPRGTVPAAEPHRPPPAQPHAQVPPPRLPEGRHTEPAADRSGWYDTDDPVTPPDAGRSMPATDRGWPHRPADPDPWIGGYGTPDAAARDADPVHPAPPAALPPAVPALLTGGSARQPTAAGGTNLPRVRHLPERRRAGLPVRARRPDPMAGRRLPPAAVAGLAVLVVAGTAAVAIGFGLHRAPAPSPAPGGGTAVGGPPPAAVTASPGTPPHDVTLTDGGSSVTLSWTYPAGADGAVVIAGGRAGQEPRPFAELPAGAASYIVYGLDTLTDFCFSVAVVYSPELVGRAEPVCTTRITASPAR